MKTRSEFHRFSGKRGGIFALMAGIIALLAALLGPVSASQAQTLDVITCTGTVTSTFHPGIRLTPQSVAFTVDGQLTNCASSADPTLQLTGSFGASGTGTFSCAASITPFTQTIHWNGKTNSSHITGTSVGPNLLGDGVYTSNGTVDSGRFDGYTYNSEGIITAPNPLACLLGPDGVTFRSGTITITLIGVGP